MLDLKLLEIKLDRALAAETKEGLTEWLLKSRWEDFWAETVSSWDVPDGNCE